MKNTKVIQLLSLNVLVEHDGQTHAKFTLGGHNFHFYILPDEFKNKEAIWRRADRAVLDRLVKLNGVFERMVDVIDGVEL